MTTGALSMIVPAIVMGINYFMDPLWCFDISHRYNQCQTEISERTQKINYITHRPFSYQGLLIGSSRSAVIPQDSFRGISVYNLSINSLKLHELIPYTEYARERNGRDFEVIFLGLDFENSERYDPRHLPSEYDPVSILAEARKLSYRFKTLFSLSTLKYSFMNLRNNSGRPFRYYDRNNRQYIKTFTHAELSVIYNLVLDELIRGPVRRYQRYVYNTGYRPVLERLKKGNPRSSFVVFLTPVSLPVMEMIVRYDLLDDYLRWIEEVLDVFGEAYLFMYPNEVTIDYYDYLFDPGHLYPGTGRMIADAIYNRKITGESRFGWRLTKETYPLQRRRLEQMVKSVRDPNFHHLFNR